MIRFVRVSTFFGWITAATICAAGFLLTSFYLYLTPNLPKAEQLKTTQLQTPLRIYSSDNKSIAEFGEKRRTPIDIAAAPPILINAFVAAEDNRFFEHHGIDIKGLARATSQLITTGRIQSGGSTITMQVAKNFFLSREKTFIRKFNEIFLALQIEQTLSKNEILELYLNKIYLGNRAYGVHAAAQVYYGKKIDELSLAQTAMIAGLPKAPSAYNPLANPSRAKIRRNWILDRMLDLQMISTEEHAQAKGTPITASYHGGATEVNAPYIAEMARQEIIRRFGSDAYTAGLKAYVTVDSRLQQAAQDALRNGLEAYDQRHGFRGPIANVEEQDIDNQDLISELLRNIKTAQHASTAVITQINQNIATALTRNGESIELDIDSIAWAAPYININRTGDKPESIEDTLAVGDIVSVRFVAEQGKWQLHQTPEAQGALVSINPKNGGIKALTGGYDFYLSKYNRATQAKRQPGSNFKAFIYLAALEEGANAATLINDAPIVFEDKNLEAAWRPENSSGKFYGPTRLRKALYNSRNLVSIRLLKETGVKKTISRVKKFGFNTKDMPKDLSLALGSAAITPLDIASGYAMLANGGHRIKPYLLERVEDSEGNILFEANPLTVCANECHVEDESESSDELERINPAPRIADERAVYILHSMLKDVIKKGTGRKALKLKRSDLAGKTGTTNDQKDAWFSGFNADLETTVWVGFDNPLTLGRREYGSRAALPIWNEYMAEALKDTPEAHMQRPQGIVTVRIDPETGELAQASQTNAIFELFREEYAPVSSSIIRNTTNNSGTTTTETISPEDIF